MKPPIRVTIEECGDGTMRYEIVDGYNVYENGFRPGRADALDRCSDALATLAYHARYPAHSKPEGS